MKKKKKKNMLPIIIFVLVLILIVAGVCAYLYVNKYVPVPDRYEGNTSGNLNNRGLFCESDGYIYFSNAYDANKLYKMKNDLTEAECIRDVPVEFINVHDKKVFFYQVPGGENQVFGLGGLYGICYTDITGNAGLNNIDKAIVNSMVLYGDALYYQSYDAKDGLTLYKASPNIKKKQKEQISSKKILVTCPYEGVFLTYNTENSYYLSFFNPDTDSIGLFDDVRAYNIVHDGNYLYYMNIDDKYRIYRYNLSTKTQEKITDYTVDLFNVYDGNVFFQRNSETEPAIIRINSDGSGEQVIAEGNYKNINCTSTYTFFYGLTDKDPVLCCPTNGGSASVFQPVLKK